MGEFPLRFAPLEGYDAGLFPYRLGAVTMDRPTIFLSSTIYDFHDMRSAIKDHLEGRGCRVLASEFNDFTKPLDRHSYQACLDTITQADLFILLIGTRVGGWYDLPRRVSITQQEYRTAYALAQKGRLRLLSLVRAEVWTHRQSVKELTRHLRTLSQVDESMRKKIAQFPTAFADDAEFIISFIDEVSRNKETAAAARGEGNMPVGNWLHPFTGFSDVRDVVDPLILNGLAVRDAAGRKALQNQLLLILRDILPLVDGKVVMPASQIRRLAKEINLSAAEFLSQTTISDKNWNSLVYLCVLAGRSKAYPAILTPYSSSDLLLEYDLKAGVYRSSQAFDVLSELVDQLRKLEAAHNGLNTAKFLEYGKIGRNRDKSVSLPSSIVVEQLHALFRWADVAALAKSLARVLDGQSLILEPPMPATPFLDQEKEVISERVTLELVRQFTGL